MKPLMKGGAGKGVPRQFATAPKHVSIVEGCLLELSCSATFTTRLAVVKSGAITSVTLPRDSFIRTMEEGVAMFHVVVVITHHAFIVEPHGTYGCCAYKY